MPRSVVCGQAARDSGGDELNVLELRRLRRGRQQLRGVDNVTVESICTIAALGNLQYCTLYNTYMNLYEYVRTIVFNTCTRIESLFNKYE